MFITNEIVFVLILWVILYAILIKNRVGSYDMPKRNRYLLQLYTTVLISMIWGLGLINYWLGFHSLVGVFIIGIFGLIGFGYKLWSEYNIYSRLEP